MADPMHDAVRAGDASAVRALADSGSPVDGDDFVLGTPLHLAVARGDRRMASILLRHGADADRPSHRQGATALHLAAEFGDTAMVDLLLEAGAAIDSRDDRGRTPLMSAAAVGEDAAVERLLDAGAEIDAVDGELAQTALGIAAFHGFLAVCEILLRHGADVGAADSRGLTPFRAAATAESYAGVGDPSLMRLLLAHGADIDARDSAGISALSWARQSRERFPIYKEIHETLLELGATP
ncbi:MAG: ankyrin repeat domain-containing protein [Azospirillaceae bacterium]